MLNKSKKSALILFFCFLMVPYGFFCEDMYLIDEIGGLTLELFLIWKWVPFFPMNHEIFDPGFPHRGELVGSWRSVTGDTAFKATHLYKYQDVCSMSILANIQQQTTQYCVHVPVCSPLSFQNPWGYDH